jgi:hypothetical protein
VTGESGQRLRLALSRIAWRITAYRLARRLSRAVLFCSIPAALVLAASRLHPLPHAAAAGVFLLAGGLVWGLLEGLRARSNLAEAALLADRRLALGELIPTALESGDSTPLGAALVDRAADRMRDVPPRRIGAFAFPWETPALLLVVAGVFALTALAPPRVAPPPDHLVRAAKVDVTVRQILTTVEDIEHRFPEAGDRVTQALEDIARRLTDPTGATTETGEAMARLGKDAEKKADRLARTEEALTEALEGKAALAEDPAEVEAVEEALRSLAGDPGLSAEGAEAAEEALAALEGGDRSAFLENAGRLEEDLERIRQTRMALEAAGLRLKASWEKLSWAWGEAAGAEAKGTGREPGEGSPSAGGSGVGAPDLTAYRETLAEPRWDPEYDEVVKRYFAALGGK